MYCDNCGNNHANVKYTQIINGVKKQMNLCNNCANELGLNNMSFSMPMDMFNFMEDIFSDKIFEPQLSMPRMLTDDVFEDEFETFRPRINTKTVQNTNALEGELDNLVYKINRDKKTDKKTEKGKTDTKEEMKLKLQKRLEQEIKEERYEDAAKTRDEIKKIDK